MRTAVVFIAPKNRAKMLELAQALARGIESQGHQVDVVDGTRDVNTKLTIYKYLAIGTEPITFTGKISDTVGPYLSNAGIISGKRCYSFVPKAFFGANRALVRLMKNMEHEGLFLKNSTILTSPEEAEEVGRRLHISG